jgi:hypothetical protein
MDYLTTHTRLSPIRRGFVPGFVNFKKGALDSPAQVIKFTSCLSMVSGSHRVLRLLPPLNCSPRNSWAIAESGIKHNKSNPFSSGIILSVYPRFTTSDYLVDIFKLVLFLTWNSFELIHFIIFNNHSFTSNSLASIF